MKKQFAVILACLLVATFLCGITNSYSNSDVVEDTQPDIDVYASLAGKSVFNLTENGRPPITKTITYEGVDQINGDDVFVIQHYSELLTPTEKDFYLTNTAQGLFYKGYYYSVTGSEILFNPPLPLLKANFTPSLAYTVSFSDNQGFSGIYSATYSYDTVIVPSGTYTDCIKTESVIESGENSLSRTWWFANGVGMVKGEFSSGDGGTSLWELVERYNAGVPDESGLAAYYPFNGNANDESGNGHDGIEGGGVGYDVGVKDQAANFDGVDDYINLGRNLIVNPAMFSFSAWLKPMGVMDDGRIVSYNPTANSDSIYFDLVIRESQLLWDIQTYNYEWVSLSANLPLQSWSFVTAQYDGTTAFLYVNGVLQETLEVPMTYYSYRSFDTYLGNNANNLSKGPFYGQIDDVRFYDRMLSVAEINELFNDLPNNIDVTPLTWDFGNVAWMGSPRSTLINIANTGGQDLTVGDASFIAPLGDFSAGIVDPSIIPAGNSVDLEVSFAPAMLGYQEGTLQINSDDPDEPEVYVALSGVGVLSEEPDEQVEAVNTFIEDEVATGDLSPDKKNSVKNIKDMLTTYGDLIADGLYTEACAQLSDIYKKVDGKPSPPDKLEGPSLDTLQDVIENMLIQDCGGVDLGGECYTDGQCMSGECDVPADANHGVCVEPLLPDGSPCEFGAECAGGVCVPIVSTCASPDPNPGASCQDDADCYGGTTCVYGGEAGSTCKFI